MINNVNVYSSRQNSLKIILFKHPIPPFSSCEGQQHFLNHSSHWSYEGKTWSVSSTPESPSRVKSTTKLWLKSMVQAVRILTSQLPFKLKNTYTPVEGGQYLRYGQWGFRFTLLSAKVEKWKQINGYKLATSSSASFMGLYPRNCGL